jgi:hypothetical protein
MKSIYSMSLLLVLFMIPDSSAAADIGYQIGFVRGTVLQLGQTDGRYFQPVGSSIQGLAFPYLLMCPGNPANSESGITCGEVLGNGFQGMSVVREHATRYDVGAIGKMPYFQVQGRQTFTGWLVLNGVRYYGSLTLDIQMQGSLNEPRGVDCFNNPANLACGAANFSGYWRIVRRESTEGLRRLEGFGTLSWAGCTDPQNPATCAVPVYQGIVAMTPPLQGGFNFTND